MKFGRVPQWQFRYSNNILRGTVLSAANPRPLKKRAAGFPLQSLARGGCRYDKSKVRIK